MVFYHVWSLVFFLRNDLPLQLQSLDAYIFAEKVSSRVFTNKLINMTCLLIIGIYCLLGLYFFFAIFFDIQCKYSEETFGITLGNKSKYRRNIIMVWSKYGPHFWTLSISFSISSFLQNKIDGRRDFIYRRMDSCLSFIRSLLEHNTRS